MTTPSIISHSFFLKYGTDDNNQMPTSSNQQCRSAITTQMLTPMTHSSLSHITSRYLQCRMFLHTWIQSKGTSRWSIPWRCQSAPAAQKAQTPVPVNLPGTSPVCCNLELQASEAYPYAVAPFHSVRPRDGPCVPQECTLDTPTPDINCRRSSGVHLNSSSSCSSGCPSCSFPLTSMAVTVRGLSVVGRDVIRLPYFQSCSSAPDVNGWGKLQVGCKEQQMSHSQRFLILFLLFLWCYMQEAIVIASRFLLCSHPVLVTSKSQHVTHM